MIQITWKAIFPHFSIDFVQISMQSTILSEETKRTGYSLRKFYSGTRYHFQEFDSGTGLFFLNFPAAPPRMFVGQVHPPGGGNFFPRNDQYGLYIPAQEYAMLPRVFLADLTFVMTQSDLP